MTTTNSPMTPEAIVRVIAERDGFVCGRCYGKGSYMRYGKHEWARVSNYRDVDQPLCPCDHIEYDEHWPYAKLMPNYLLSRDALFPVIGKLSNDESLRLSAILWEEWESQLDGRLEVIMLMKNESFEIWLLTLPPETLAPLVARAIVESK